MKQTRVLISILLLAAPVLASLPAEDEEVRFPGLQRGVQWQRLNHEEQTAAAMIFVAWLPDRELTRVLLETPAGRRLVLTKEHFALDGVVRYRIADDELGWWAELTEESGLVFDNIEQLAQPTEVVRHLLKEDSSTTLTLRASGLSDFEWATSLWDEAKHDDLFEQLDFEGRGEQLLRAMPRSTRSAVGMLAKLLAADDADTSLAEFRALVRTVMAALERYEEASELRRLRGGGAWEVAERTAKAGILIEDETAAQFVAAFNEVPARDPLSDLRLVPRPRVD